jgi:hypothetical protein
MKDISTSFFSQYPCVVYIATYMDDDIMSCVNVIDMESEFMAKPYILAPIANNV